MAETPTQPHWLGPLDTMDDAIGLASKRLGRFGFNADHLDKAAEYYDAAAQGSLKFGHPDMAGGQLVRAAQLRAWSLILRAREAAA